MGTTLTGTTPQDTYDSLIKVTDNGPLSATAKRLSDGLGNDSALALSTSRVGINQSNPTVARLEIVESTNAEALRVDGSGSGFAFVVNGGTSYKSAIRNASVGSSYFSTAAPSNGLIVEGNVGIGTSSPAQLLTLQNGNVDNVSGSRLRMNMGPNPYWELQANNGGIAADRKFVINTSAAAGDVLTLTQAGNVGIGTSSPAAGYKLDVAGRTKAYNAGYIADFVSTESNASSIQLYADNTNVSIVQGGTAAVPLTFFIGGSERMRITSAGNVGIGTSSTTGKLTVRGEIDTIADIAGAGYGSRISNPFNGVNAYDLAFSNRTNSGTWTEVGRFLAAGGLTFNGDTAAANALDDYEEGTWTPTISFGGSSTGITYQSNGGRYTKIGRQVTVTSYILLTSKGSATGSARVEGLPFASASGVQFYPTANLSAISAITYVGMLQAYVNIGFTTIDLVETTEAGSQSAITDADFTNASQIILSATYFV